MEDGVLEVQSTSGDTHLGGEDFDRRLMDYFITDFKKKYKKDISKNKKSLRKLLIIHLIKKYFITLLLFTAQIF